MLPEIKMFKDSKIIILNYSLGILIDSIRKQTTGISHLTKIHFQVQINLLNRGHIKMR